MKYKYLKLLAIIQQKKIIPNLLLLLLVGSSNFAAYLSYYDLNALMIIDITAITKYIFNTSITFALISASISVLILISQKYILATLSLIMPTKKLNTFFGESFFKLGLTILIFLFVFIGINNTIVVILISIFIIILLTTYNILLLNESLNIWTIIQNHNITKALSKKYHSQIINDIKSYYKKGDYLKFILNEIGVFIILFTLAVGIGRAEYVEQNIQVKLKENSQVYTLYITTSNGIGLYDSKASEVRFIPWGNVDNLIFLSEKRRSFNIF